MANRLISVDSVSLQMPDDIREQNAENTGVVGTPERAALAAHYAPVGDQGQRLIATLEARSPSVNIAIAGDSTADAVDEWPYVLAQNLAAAYPHLTVIVKNWNPGTLAYYVGDLTVQTGTGSTFAFNRTRRDLFHRTVSDIIGTNTEEGATPWVDGGGAGAAALNWSADGTSAVAGAHTTRAPMVVSTGQQGSSRTRWTYEFGALTGARQVDHFIRRASDSNRLFITTALNGDGTVFVQLAKRISSTTTSVQSLGNIAMPVGRTFVIEANVIVNGDGTATIRATVNGTALTGTLSAVEWTAVNGGFNQGWFVVNGTPTGDRQHLFEFSLAEVVFAQQVLTIYNGSAPGTTLDYQTTHRATMYPSAVTFDQIWVASSHNETTMAADTFVTKVEAFLEGVRAVHPNITPILSSQNPEFRPGITAARIGAHRVRCAALRAHAAKKRYGYVPVIETWEKEADGGLALVSSDGLHPATGVGSGSEFWGGIASDYLAQYATP